MTNAMSNTVAFGQIGKRSVFIALLRISRKVTGHFAKA